MKQKVQGNDIDPARGWTGLHCIRFHTDSGRSLIGAPHNGLCPLKVINTLSITYTCTWTCVNLNTISRSCIPGPSNTSQAALIVLLFETSSLCLALLEVIHETCRVWARLGFVICLHGSVTHLLDPLLGSPVECQQNHSAARGITSFRLTFCSNSSWPPNLASYQLIFWYKSYLFSGCSFLWYVSFSNRPANKQK